MSFDTGLVAWVEEAMAPLGAVTMRRMMGGATLYCDRIIFAIIADGELWFKADAVSAAEWDALGADRFSYAFRNGKTGSMNYRRAPGEVYDDGEALLRLGALALAAGRRSKGL